MRFTKANMPALNRLIQDVKMKSDVVQFRMQPEGPLNNNNRYFRGRYFTDWYATHNPNIWSQVSSVTSSSAKL